MKSMLLATAGIALSALIFAGCHSLPTVQKQFQTQCSIVNGDLQTIGTSPLLNAAQQAKVMNVILPANQAICKAGAQLNVADLKAFHDSLLPAVVTIVSGIPDAAFPEKTAVLLALNTFGPMVQAMVDQLITAVATPASGASAAVPASAPAAAPTAASSTLVAEAFK
jgi:hypothetical protein